MDISADILAITGYEMDARWNAAAPLGTPVVVTYSFGLWRADYDDEARRDYHPYTEAQKEDVRAALQVWDDASGIAFVEVPDSQGGMIRFGQQNGDYYGFAGLAYYPQYATDANDFRHVLYDGLGGDVFLDSRSFAYLDDSTAPGEFGFKVLLHEIGHALGFKHPFHGDPVIDPAHDHSDYTIMSYDGTHVETALGSVDIEASRLYYGESDIDYSYNADLLELTQRGTEGDDWILGIDVRDVISAGGGNDMIVGGPGRDEIDGGEGVDTAVFTGLRAEYTLREVMDSAVIVFGPDGADTLRNVEEVRFEDSIVFLDERRLSVEDAKMVAYLYEAGLDRNGDLNLDGVNFWIDAREQGLSEYDLAGYFFDSPEFAERFGDEAKMSDRALVEQLYRNVLDREGRTEGVEYWSEALSNGMDRPSMLLAFAESEENIAGSPHLALLAETEPGYWDFA